ncbi:hypothetical protein ESCO_002796 [Escovopsis weberi]|uniref:Uncharacterized protein n=1 Tax=Escovopsis weberi TaxID=150374 RepID=A0A0M8MVN3_ESCWE|nr:hypothetical protein ESCO_002796 [Escovopsis weberi]
MASSNPFRKSLAPVESPSRGRPGADGVGKENIGLGPDGDAATQGPTKKKSVKKVRVLSPPPRSPGPREVLTSPPPPPHPPPTWSEVELQALRDAYPEVMGPVGGGQGLGSPILMHPQPQAQTKIQWPALIEAHDDPAAAGSQEQVATPAPTSANPFSKALHELGTEAEKPAARRSLNSSSGASDDANDDNDSLSNDPIIKALELELNGSTTPDQELPNPLASPAVPNSAKKPVPAPPPRRGHARAESKARAIQAALSPQHSDPPSRTSMDSERSGASSIRQSTTAPLPPPPRRPPIAPRQPSATSLTNPSSPNGPQNDHEHYTIAPEPPINLAKAGARPPPPPARHSSTARRPPSILGIDPSSRRVSSDSRLREGMAPPPPPPPPSRHRESSQSSLEGSHRPRSSVEVIHADLPDAADTRIRSSSPPTPGAGKSTDILADLDALQREVDALRGRIG